MTKLRKPISQPEITDAINRVSNQYPYKQEGNRDSYSSYNEGFQDACDLIEHEVVNLFKDAPSLRTRLRKPFSFYLKIQFWPLWLALIGGIVLLVKWGLGYGWVPMW